MGAKAMTDPIKPTKGEHPIDAVLATLSNRDVEIANKLYEQGFSDEDLYQALPNKAVDRFLKRKP
jgi:hypothetical protein